MEKGANRMKRYVGLWIDHEKAMIAVVGKEARGITRIDSEVKGHIRLSGGSRSKTPYGPQDIRSEKRIEERRKHHLIRYYDKVIDLIQDADKILILGPGEAKRELEKRMTESKDLAAKITKIEAADKMTERQLAAKAKKFFLSPS
jgi:hypothetical protein